MDEIYCLWLLLWLLPLLIGSFLSWARIPWNFVTSTWNVVVLRLPARRIWYLLLITIHLHGYISRLLFWLEMLITITTTITLCNVKALPVAWGCLYFSWVGAGLGISTGAVSTTGGGGSVTWAWAAICSGFRENKGFPGLQANCYTYNKKIMEKPHRVLKCRTWKQFAQLE